MHSILLYCYSLLFGSAALLLRLLAPLHPRLKAQVTARDRVAQLAPRIALERARYRHCAVFFCSSAGEFEQAKPLINKLTAMGSVYVQVIFFSQSGLTFAKARGETVPCCLSPITDSATAWGWLFSALRPTFTCVVRHELWPGFLSAAQRFGRLYLIDASCGQGERHAARKRWLRAYLLQMFHAIYTVGSDDIAFFRDTYGVAAERLVCTGDTKYDRVLERAGERVTQVTQLRDLFDRWAPSRTSKRMILGSAYREEVSLWLAALASRSVTQPQWQVVLAPHHLDPEFLDWCQKSCESGGLTVIRQSLIELEQPPTPGGAAVILIDCMGILSEVYGTGSAALVGGALHHQVHNVLEPACHGLALAFGPAYKNSHEAIHLVELGLAKVIASTADFAAWWRSLDDHNEAMAGNVKKAVTNLAGASNRIMTAWQAHLGS